LLKDKHILIPLACSCLDKNFDANLPRLILKQFVWLEHIVKPEALTRVLLEAVEYAPNATLKSDIISQIPEIIDDSQHAAIVLDLRTRMENDSDVIVPAIGCLAGLSLKEHLLVSVRLEDLFVFLKLQKSLW